MKETYFNNMYKLGKHESGGITDIGFIDYIKELGFVDKNEFIISVGVVWERKDDEIHIEHIYDNTGVHDASPGKGILVDFSDCYPDNTYSKEHEDLYESILMYAELDETFL
tara:strand:- start:3331 stop:3663 length:333 start_codon:yes stop_codon:yes gene_type:complete